MKLIEGQAYFPETREELTVLGKANYISEIFEGEKPVTDGAGVNGTASPFPNENILAGRRIGSSQLASGNAQTLWDAIRGPTDEEERPFHGAGSRFIESTDGSDSLIDKCIKFLPQGSADPYDIKPNYDLEMDLLGWYETNDQTGGQNTRLTINSDNEVVDDRRKMPYYRKTNGNYKRAFEPVYWDILVLG